jgi:hypothetical protein
MPYRAAPGIVLPIGLRLSFFRSSKTFSLFIFKEYPAACCGDSQETVLRKAAYSACND